MYETRTAQHYAAYRPPLHKIILQKIFTLPVKHQRGLDIGCGTGLSCLALTGYCNHVIGIDQSLAMLTRAEPRQGVDYLNADGLSIPLTGNSIDVVTLAGSLNYLDRQLLMTELKRVCRTGAEIAVYDFEIDLSLFESLFECEKSIDAGSYNHSLNLSALDEVEEKCVVIDEVLLNPTAGEITHLLLADDGWHRILQVFFGPSNLFESIKRKIEPTSKQFTIKARIYYSLYLMTKPNTTYNQTPT